MSSTSDIPRTDLADAPGPEPRTITDMGDFLDSMVHDVKGFVSTERAYLTLLLARRTAEVSRSLIGLVVGALLGTVLWVFISIAVALALGRAWDDAVAGYLAVAAFHAVVLVVFAILWRGPLGERLQVRMINMLHGH